MPVRASPRGLVRPLGPLESMLLGPQASPRTTFWPVTSPWEPASSPDAPLKVVLPDRAPSLHSGDTEAQKGYIIVQAQPGSSCSRWAARTSAQLPLPHSPRKGVLLPGHPGTPGSPLPRASLYGSECTC